MRLFDKLHVVMLSIRVLILSDDPLVRNALSSLLPEEKTIDLVGQAPLMGLGEDLLDVYRPDVLLVVDDKAVPALRQILIALDVPYIRLLAEHTSFSESRSESNTLPRDVDLGVLSAALHAVTEGLSVYPQPEGFTPPFNHQMDYPIEKLTAREGEVLQLIGHGLNDLFGKHLKRSINTSMARVAHSHIFASIP